MSILVIGGTGTVGSQVVANLLDRGGAVQVMTRSKEKAATLPTGAEAVIANTADHGTMLQAFGDIETIMLITALHPDEAAHGQFVVKAAKKAGVKKIVYLSVVLPPNSLHIPHFASKIPIEAAIKESGMAFVILRPTHFFQNDYWFQDAIMKQGIYPEPIGNVGITRIDVRDIADMAILALTESAHDGRTFSLHGREVFVGRDIARMYTKHLGTEVNYAGNDLDAWAQAASQAMPVWMVHDLKIMYDFFQRSGIKASAQDHMIFQQVMGREPRAYDAFVAETVEFWKKVAG